MLRLWASNELGIAHTELAKKLEMRPAGITFSVVRGGYPIGLSFLL
jgi:hypothetical protein